ncbi:hypothetical protein Tco_1179738, partial [Tanacetum coccineum]
KIPKPKYVKNKADPESSPKKKSAQASTRKRLKATAKVAKSGKKKQPAQGLETLSEIAFGSCVDEGTGVLPGVPDVPTYGSKDEQISWKSSDEDNNDEANLSENDDDQDDDNDDNKDDDGQDYENKQTESDNDGDDFVYPKFSTHDEEERQDEEDKEEEGNNVEGEELDEDETNEEEEVNKLYRDVNVNLEGRDTEMMDALLANVQTTQVIEDTHVIITAVTPKFEDRVKALEDNFSEFKQTNLFAKVVSLIPGIVDTLRSEAQADNEDFINKIDENMKKIIKEQVKVQVKEQVSKILLRIKKLVNDQLEAEVLIRSSNEAKTSHAENLYKSLVDAYETDKDILETYGDTVTLKRRQDDEDEDEEPSARSNRGSKRRRAEKEPESTSAPKEKTSKTREGN